MSRYSDLLLAQGNQAAQLALARRNVWADFARDISQIPAQVQERREREQLRQQQFDLANRRETRETVAAQGAAEVRLAELEKMRREQARDEAEKLQAMNATQEDVQQWIRDRTGKLWTPAESEALLQRASQPEGHTKILSFLAPLRPPKPVTYGQPFDATVDGKHVLLRTTSEGKTIDMQGKEVTGAIGAFEKPEKADKPDYEWVTRGGQPMQIPKGSAQAGDVPYAKPEKPDKPDFEWVTRAGKPVQIVKGTARAGDVPYRGSTEGLTPNAALDATLKLRDRFVRETKSATTITQQLANMRSSLDAVKQGSAPAGSQGVLVTFQKILDPTSVVRESEYARSASGLSLLGRLEGKWEQIKQGGAGVTVADLEGFVNLAEQFARNQATFANETKGQIDNIASEYGLKPENITRDLAPKPTIGQIIMVKGKRLRVTKINPDGTYSGVLVP